MTLRLAPWLGLVAALAGSAADAQEGEPPTVRGEREEEGRHVERLRELPVDLRSLVVLRYECASEIGRREVTLFGNGTVRLLDGPPGEEEMELGELGPDRLDGVLARLDAENLSEAPAHDPGVEGDWVEHCVLELPLQPGAGAGTFRFTRYSSLPLSLSRVIAVAEELVSVAAGERSAGIPSDYEPRRWDVLRREDGARFRVVGLTSDGKGVELEGLDVPLTLYLSPDALRDEFVEIVSRRAEGW